MRSNDLSWFKFHILVHVKEHKIKILPVVSGQKVLYITYTGSVDSDQPVHAQAVQTQLCMYQESIVAVRLTLIIAV